MAGDSSPKHLHTKLDCNYVDTAGPWFGRSEANSIKEESKKFRSMTGQLSFQTMLQKCLV